ncbi:hypothetical protein BGZ88_011696 [Linnemannia elongata]|nr:hypothetical protein BGZ88_011696 [Linnemannia elongata]
MVVILPNDRHHIVDISGVGKVKGLRDTCVPVVRFLGVPFATVHKRWNPALPAQPWSGVLDCTKLGPAAPGPTRVTPFLSMLGFALESPYETVFDERNCLNLNIFAPDDSVLLRPGEERRFLPVMVWVYGGAFRSGGINAPLFDFTNFVAASVKREQPVLVVSINFRGGDFGHLASKELRQNLANDPSLQGEHKAVGNWGLQDQKLAFLWVREHIAAFGGDSLDITAVGSSSGATALSYHMMIPAHHGLFHKAVLQSGALCSFMTQNLEHDGQAYFDRLCCHFGIPLDTSAEKKVARLRAIPERDLAAFSEINDVSLYHPTADGILIDRNVACWHNDSARLDPGLRRVLLGLNSNECAIMGGYAITKAELWPFFRDRLGGSDPELGKVFDEIYGQPVLGQPDSDNQSMRISRRVIGDGMFHGPVLNFASLLLKASADAKIRGSGKGLDVSFYYFDCTIDKFEQMRPGLGAAHAFEVPYVIDSLHARNILTPQEQAFSKQVQAVWLEYLTIDRPEILPRVTQLWRRTDDDRRDVAEESNVIIFRRNLTISRCNVYWTGREMPEWWARFIEYQKDLFLQGDYTSHGRALNTFSAAELCRARL